MALVFLLCLWHAHSMFHKRPIFNKDKALEPAKRLKANLEDLFLGADVPASRAQSLFADAAVHDPSCENLGKAGAGSHAARDLTRKLKKKSQ